MTILSPLAVLNKCELLLRLNTEPRITGAVTRWQVARWKNLPVRFVARLTPDVIAEMKAMPLLE